MNFELLSDNDDGLEENFLKKVKSEVDFDSDHDQTLDTIDSILQSLANKAH